MATSTVATITIPSPTAEDSVKLQAAAANKAVYAATVEQIDVDQILYRVVTVTADAATRHGSVEKAARHFATHCYAGGKGGRFDPIHRKGKKLAPLYAGFTQEAALWESVLRNVMPGMDYFLQFGKYEFAYIVKIRPVRPLKVVSMIGACSINLPAPCALLHSVPREDYEISREWAQAVLDAFHDTVGVNYLSYMLNNERNGVAYKHDDECHLPPMGVVGDDSILSLASGAGMELLNKVVQRTPRVVIGLRDPLNKFRGSLE